MEEDHADNDDGDKVDDHDYDDDEEDDDYDDDDDIYIMVECIYPVCLSQKWAKLSPHLMPRPLATPSIESLL